LANRWIGLFVLHSIEVLVCSSKALFYQALKRVQRCYFAGIQDPAVGVEYHGIPLVS
jgi:hypothetical protein